MDHLPWYSQSHLSPVKVPFICGDELLCGKDEFLEFPTRQGWELKESESIAQLAARAQAWLFFGLLAVAGIPPDVCISVDTSTIADQMINTSALPSALCIRPVRYSDDESSLDDLSSDDILELIKALTRAEHAMIQEIIPLINDYEEEPLTLWNSPFYAVLFSIDILMETIAIFIRSSSQEGEQESFSPQSLLSKRTVGVAHSLLQAGKCPSLAYRLDIRASEFYHLLSLPTIPMTENHSECSQTSCSCFDVDTISYQTRHTDDCIMCEHLAVNEGELVNLIQQDEVTLLRSTMDSEGNVTISLTQMNVDVDHTAISHVWAGGLGNFNENSLPHCQLQAIHRDVCNTMWRSRGGNKKLLFPAETYHAERRNCGWWPTRRNNTCYYWLDTLCIPIRDYNMKIRAINSMGRIYAGARNILVLDPSLSRTKYNDLGDSSEREIRGNLLVAASPWMARSWPLQEATLAPEIYIKFADEEIYYRHSSLGVAATLSSIPHQDMNRLRLTWFGGFVDDISLESAGQVRAYEPSTDFVKIWNILCKRTTSHPADVPAIFAALLHKSSGELLQIPPHRRTQAIMNVVESLPLDNLCVKQNFHGNQGTTPALNWVPEFPGSKVLISQLDSRWGTLRRVRDGFVIEMNEKEPTATLAMMCPSGLLPSGKSIVRDDHTMKSFLVQVNRPPSTFKDKASNSAKQTQLLLLLSKDHSHIPFLKHGILCTVITETVGLLRVQFDVAISWSSQEDENSEHASLHSFRVEPSSSIVIEMDVDQWPTLAWSRFKAFPYQHLEAQYLTLDMRLAYMIIDVIWIVFLIVSACFIVPESTDLNPPGSYLYMPYCTLFTLMATPVRFWLACLEGEHINSEMARRARYIWALSFWDLDENKRVLSQLHNSVSLTTFLKTLIPALIFSSLLAILITRHVSMYIWLSTTLPFVMEYSCRLVLLIYLRVQWFFSTLEFRNYPAWALSSGKLVSTLLQAHFFRLLMTINWFLGVATAGMVVTSIVVLLQRDHKYIGDGHYSEKLKPRPLYIITGVLMFIIGLMALLAGCSNLGFIVLDFFRRTGWLQGWSKKRRLQIRNQNVELV